MKLISLNVWGGKLFDRLMDFLGKWRDEADIFCFQEVPMGEKPVFTGQWLRENLFAEMKASLPDFGAIGFPSPPGGKFQGQKLEVPFGNAVFVNKKFKMGESGGFLTYSETSAFAKSRMRTPTGNLQYATIVGSERSSSRTVFDEDFLICNIHGIWLPEGHKNDSPERIEQSEKILNFLENRGGNKEILCGDFNLRPETESIAMLTRKMRNLIKEYKIENTRNDLYRNEEKYRDRIADYIFVSPDVEIGDFMVLGDEVSDHQPLFIEFF